MHNIKLSIIIATYNSELYIKESIESVINSSFNDWECLIIDGGSKDKTVDIVKEFEKIDSRIRHISESDKGIYDAFNKGWRMAKGEWIYYLGSDDRLMPEGISGLISNSERADIVYGDMVYLTGLAVKSKKSIPTSELKGNMPSHQSMIIKRSVIESLDGFDWHNFKLCADFDLFQRAIKSGAVVNYADGVVVSRFNGLGASSGIKQYMKECFCIKRDNRGFLFALKYVVLESIKRYAKSAIMAFLRK